MKTDFIQALLPQGKRPPCKTGSTLNSVWTSGVYSQAAGGGSWVESCKEEISGLGGFWLNQLTGCVLKAGQGGQISSLGRRIW